MVIFTWGNVSAVDRERGLVAIKPSGVDYAVMKPEDIVIVDREGNRVEGAYNPSTDLPTHLELYKAFPHIGGVAHTHSASATAWAQAGRDIPCYGTTHADYFYGPVPCTRMLTQEETGHDYEKHTGLVIAERFAQLDPMAVPGALVRSHGVFTWGRDAAESVYHAVVLENIAEMALKSEALNKDLTPAPGYLLDRHYLRKHGKDAYYGQSK